MKEEETMLYVHYRFDDWGLPSDHYRLYANLKRRGGASGVAYPSIKTIAGDCGFHPKTVRRIIKALVAWGFIEQTLRSGKKTHYTITHWTRWKPLKHPSPKTPLPSEDPSTPSALHPSPPVVGDPSPAGVPNPSPAEPPKVHKEGYKEEVQGKGGETPPLGVPPLKGGLTATPTLQEAQDHFAQFGDAFNPDHVKRAWQSFEGTKNPEDPRWYWGRRPVFDWRHILEVKMGDYQKNGAAAAITLREAVKSVEGRLNEIADWTDPESANERAKLRREKTRLEEKLREAT